MYYLILIISEITQPTGIRVAYNFYKIKNNALQKLLRNTECDDLI